MEFSRERSRCSRSVINLDEINDDDDLSRLTLSILRAMDSQTVYCVKETICTWPSVPIHTPLVPTEREVKYSAADRRYFRSYFDRLSTIRAQTAESNVLVEHQM